MTEHRIRSLSDLPKEQMVRAIRENNFQPWEPRDIKKQMLNQATVTLRAWLDGRLADLLRERVPLEEIIIKHRGNVTTVYAAGKPRFEFKIKCTMEGK